MIRQLYAALLGSRLTPVLLAATIVINLLGLAVPMYSIQILNRYVSIGLTPTLVTLTVGALVAILFEVLLRRQRQGVLLQLAAERDRHASERVFRAFTGGRLEALGQIPMATRREALGAPAALQQLGSATNFGTLLDLPFVALYLIMAGLLFAPFGIIGTAGCLLALLLGIRAERGQRAAAEDHASASGRSQQLSQFLLSAGEAVRCLPLIGPLSRRWRALQGDSLGSRRDTMGLQGNLQTSIQSLGQMLTVGVYTYGAVAAVMGDLSTGALIGGNILVSRAFAVCSRAAYLAEPTLRAQRADDALKEVEQCEQESHEGAKPAQLRGHLELFDGAFAYPQQPTPIFERLSFSAEPGQVVVVAGPNGAGKTTLIKVLLGLLAPQRGMVRADSIELRQLSAAWWRMRVGYAPQEPVFFDATLRENLLLDRPVDDAMLIELIQEMGLDGFLAQDQQGLERPMNSTDAGMAVGQRRRFALIRAVLGDPRILFFDDPTEGLDQAGMAAVAKLLNRLVCEGRTLVVASNENFILRAADLVIDMSAKPVPKLITRAELQAGNVPGGGAPGGGAPGGGAPGGGAPGGGAPGGALGGAALGGGAPPKVRAGRAVPGARSSGIAAGGVVSGGVETLKEGAVSSILNGAIAGRDR